jgi:basic membrane protein A
MIAAGVAAVVVGVVIAGSVGTAKAPAAAQAGFKAALVSDVAGFNDNGFNKAQLAGLKAAAKAVHGTAIPLVSHSSSDYQPNYNTAIHDGAGIIVAAGFLLADTMKTYAQAYPKVDFAITDDSIHDPALGNLKNEEGITYATQQGGCLVGVLAAEEANSMGKKIIGVAGGLEIPPVDSYIAGYKYCADRAVPGTKILVQYSGSFTDESKCAAIAQNEINKGAEVIFQVAGLCGDGALKEASKLQKWGIGVDADEYNVAKRILTSALKKTGVGVEKAVERAARGAFKHTDLLLSLKNNGVGVGRINPAVNSSWISLMNKYKQQIIKGTLKPPAACPHNKCA